MGARLGMWPWPLPEGTRACESRPNSRTGSGRLEPPTILTRTRAFLARFGRGCWPTTSTARAGSARCRSRPTPAPPGARALRPRGDRTLVAMSGGVDSAAAAQLALDRGDEVIGVTLELWADPAGDGERSCCSPQAVAGARALAHRMGIPHLTLDV